VQAAASHTLVIAHRGAWGPAVENTIEAFERAIALGVDMIEFDVRRTSDRQLVVYHDAEVRGVATRSRRFDQLTAKGASSRPPLLEDVLQLARGRVAVDLELKEPGYVEEVVGQLASFGFGRCLLTSFDEDVVLEAKARAPLLSTGLLIDAASRVPMATRLRRSRADYLGLELRLADPLALSRLAAAGARCLIWTVNDASAIERCLADPAVDGVITDRPKLALDLRGRLTERTVPSARG
jgi:glycerophosphoryl diester phosphodiesterase